MNFKKARAYHPGFFFGFKDLGLNGRLEMGKRLEGNFESIN
jgi:hypothetical protein